MAEPLLSIEIRDWMDANNWGVHHTNWHFSRLWEIVPQMQNWVTAHGGQRATAQEGEPGNGIEFLAMHRAMMQSIQAVFPQMEPLFSAWAQVPQNPDDPLEPMPNNGEPRAFDPDKLAALNRINSDLSGFQSEDELGLFLQTSRRPQLGNPLALSPDPEAGLHNYLHLRLGYPITDPTNFEFGMRNHNQNFKNERFWRLHGWIDRVWAEYRRLKGITSYNDPGHETGHDMLLHRHHPLMHHHHPLIVQPLPLIDAFAMEVTSQPRMVRHLL